MGASRTIALLCMATAAPGTPALAGNATTRCGDNTNNCVFQDSELTPTAVTNGVETLTSFTADDIVRGQPLYVVNGVSGHNTVYVATMVNSVCAFDADTGAGLWTANSGTSGCINYDGGHAAPSCYSCGDLCRNHTYPGGTIGIVGTPVIDASAGLIYFVTDWTVNGSPQFNLHAVNLSNGGESSGSPVLIDAGTAFNGQLVNQRGGLALANGYVYVPFGSNCDSSPYSGYVFAFQISPSLAQVGWVESSNANQDGIWQGASSPTVDSSGSVYVSTGNGAWDGTANFSDSVLRFDAGLPAAGPASWFTAGDQVNRDSNGHDRDLGLAPPTLVPGTDELLQGGKFPVDANDNPLPASVYLLTQPLANAKGSSTCAPNSTPACFQPTNGDVHQTQMWASPDGGLNLYIWGGGDTIRVFRLDAGSSPSITALANSGSLAGCDGGGRMAISANGNPPAYGSGVFWGIAYDPSGVSTNRILAAFDAENFTSGSMNLLWSTSLNRTPAFHVPAVANHTVYVVKGQANGNDYPSIIQGYKFPCPSAGLPWINSCGVCESSCPSGTSWNTSHCCCWKTSCNGGGGACWDSSCGGCNCAKCNGVCHCTCPPGQFYSCSTGRCCSRPCTDPP